MALALGAIFAAQAMVSAMRPGERWTLSHALIMHTPFWLLWAAFFPLIVLIARRLPVRLGQARLIVPLHLLIGLVVAIAHFTLLLYFMGVIGHATWAYEGHTWGQHYLPRMREDLLAHIITYFLLLVLIFAWMYYRQLKERELQASRLAEQLSQARLHALRMQLNPHFLFNALNSIAMLVRRSDQKQAVTMLAGLSDLLRHVLEESGAEQVRLSDELTFLRRYLDIEKIRFSDRLHVDFDIADETLDAFVPNLVLQPLVENAIRHGVGRKVGAGTVRVIARKLDDRLVLQVSDDGPGLSQPAVVGAGVGLGNTRARLAQLYAEQGRFELHNRASGGAVASITIPFRTRPLDEAVSAA
ncbi:MAG TPA: histidine kinase [Longimicrobiales bacterium]|nr:histidine kinase [Longimicrobiales bacterium]